MRETLERFEEGSSPTNDSGSPVDNDSEPRNQPRPKFDDPLLAEFVISTLVQINSLLKRDAALSEADSRRISTGIYKIIERSGRDFRKDMENSASEAALDASADEVDETMTDSDRYTDLSIAASEARVDAKFASLKGSLDVVSANFTNLSSQIAQQRAEAGSARTAIITTIIGTGIGVVALVLAAIAFGATTFYNGTVVKDMVDRAAMERIDAATPASEPKK